MEVPGYNTPAAAEQPTFVSSFTPATETSSFILSLPSCVSGDDACIKCGSASNDCELV